MGALTVGEPGGLDQGEVALRGAERAQAVGAPLLPLPLRSAAGRFGCGHGTLGHAALIQLVAWLDSLGVKPSPKVFLYRL
ncbi:hypothetical protein SFR_1527 [Streptomyces sp. FR-008]|nr:hypothetical protein SFR_1527 [Streptomyces sp. FR-008]